MRQFVESLRRLYMAGKIDEKKIIELFVNKKINNDEKWYVLNSH